jgi:ABC-2 type transport system permease protein
MTLFAVMRLELRRLFVRPLGWILAALTLVELAWRYVLLLGNFLGTQIRLAALPSGPGFTDMVSVPLLSSLLTGGMLPFGLTELALLIVPLLAMSTLAGERSNGTLSLLFGAGLSGWSIVYGKYLALLVWLLLWLLLILAMPLSLAHATTFDWGKLAAATLGVALLLAALAAIGVACSAFTAHPAIAATASILLVLGLFIVQLGAQAVGIDNGVINWLALPSHLEPLLRGLVSTTDVLWFVLVVVLALALATRRLNADKERG